MKHILCVVALLVLTLTSSALFSQNQNITGTVLNSDNEPLIGVTVRVKDSDRAVITDINGSFSIEAIQGEILVFSFIGMESQEKVVGTDDISEIVLLTDETQLEDIVVVGYGTVEKSDLTGSVVSVSGEQLQAVGSTSPMLALQANSPGVNISQNTGSVGSEFSIQIRGTNSLTGGQPLYVVDGVITDNINFLNPNDIEQIDILKDASSTAIYGSRGSNGVVIVSTKTGAGNRNRKATISYNGFVGSRNIANMPDFLDTYDESVQWLKDRQVALDLVRGNPIENTPMYGFPVVILEDGTNYWEENYTSRNGLDWKEALIRPSTQQNHFISAAGGGENIGYVVGFGFQGDNGNAERQSFEKFNFKAGVDANVASKFGIGTNINIAKTVRELVSRQGYTQQIFRMPTWAPAYDLDGDLVQSPMVGYSGNVNPYAYLETDSRYDVDDYYLVSNFYLNYEATDWLKLSSTFSPNGRFTRTGEYFDRFATRSISVARMWNDIDFSYIWDNQANITKEIGDHSFTNNFIQSLQFDQTENAFAFGRDVPFQTLWYNTQSAPQRDASTGFSKSTLMSFTNRVNYSFKDKYLFTGTLRWDGSSRLAEENRWALFPSMAVAWKMGEEEFIQNSNTIDNLKLRLSYGNSGNQALSPYRTSLTIDRQTYYDWDGDNADGFIPSTLANPDLTWEKTREVNFGIDYDLFDYRLSGEINLYDRLSKGSILERRLPLPTGWPSILDNVASVNNRGLELSLNTVNIDQQDFSWTTNFIFSTNKNKIVDLYGSEEDDVPNRWFIGHPVNVVYAMVPDGVWQRDELDPADLQAMEGTSKVKDLNGDGVIDIQNDMAILGSPDPSWIGTFSTSLNYKNWDFTGSVFTKQGVFTFSPFHREFTDFNSRLILDVPYYRRESPISPARYSNSYPQPAFQGQYWGEDAEDFGYPGFNKDASFVRVQNLTLGYHFNNSSLSDQLGFSDFRIYANALNPFLFTDYEGFDPEWAGAGMSGVDATNTSYRIFQLGLNIKF